MKRIFLFIAIALLFTQCDDGNFDEPSFIFDNNIDSCGDFIVFNIGQDDSEALILDINFTNTSDVFYKTERIDEEFDLTNKIFYRVFDGALTSDYFCQSIPPVSPSIIKEWSGSGVLIVNNTIVNDDNDGVEELDHDLDSDGDLIKDYLDIDDDNDSILTSDEINSDGTVLDSDGDQVPDYLDTDDDNDGIPTLNEFSSDDTNGDSIDDYLDDTTVIVRAARDAIPNKYTLSYTTTFVVQDMHLTNGDNAINYSNYEYGVKTGSFQIIE